MEMQRRKVADKLRKNIDAVEHEHVVLRHAVGKGFCSSVPLGRVTDLDHELTPVRCADLPDEEEDFDFAERFAAPKPSSRRSCCSKRCG